MNDEKVVFEEVKKLRNYIEENIRATSKSGLDFIDPKRIKDQIILKQNHVIFGRRGAGKSTLLKVLNQNNILSVYINLEDYKDISFPNVLISVLIEILEKVIKTVESNLSFWEKRKFKKDKIKLQTEIKKLQNLKLEQDDIEKEITTSESISEEIGVGVGVKSDFLSSFMNGKTSNTNGIIVKSKINENKLNKIRISLADIKKIIQDIFKIHKMEDKSLYVILDDFYFIKIENQPYLIDYIHRLTKDTNLFFKIGTIKHRTRLYIKDETFIGVELRNDATEIDLDYTLEEYERIENFMKEIINYCIKESNANIEIDDMFMGDGFSQLCLASGGVPRDFLSIFHQLATKCLIANEIKIGKLQVTEEAISNLSDKITALKRDTFNEEELFEAFIYELRKIVFKENKTNCFLVSKEQLDNEDIFRQIIKELFDLRLIHLLDKNTSAAPSDGKRYEAYLLDLSLYENSRPLRFKQIDPTFKDEKSRKDDVRASVRLISQDYIGRIKRNLEEKEKSI